MVFVPLLSSCAYFFDNHVVVAFSSFSLWKTYAPFFLFFFYFLLGMVWVATIVGTMVWGVTLWVLLKLKQDISEKHQLSLASSLFYGWGLLLEDQPYDPPVNTAGQVGNKNVVL